MTPFEYLITFISVLVGLSVTDLATSLHRLLRARRRVRWDWLPLGTALLALISVLDVWWGLYGIQETEWTWTIASFSPFVAALVVLFLLNAAALPDDVPSEGLDLRAFYDENKAYFWSLFVIYIVIALVINLMPIIAQDWEGWQSLSRILSKALSNLLVIGFLSSLLFVRNRLFHSVAVVALLVFLIYQWFDRSLGAF